MYILLVKTEPKGNMTKHASILGIKVYEPHALKVLWWVNQIAPCGRKRKGKIK
jgi:hypothetical protein